MNSFRSVLTERDNQKSSCQFIKFLLSNVTMGSQKIAQTAFPHSPLGHLGNDRFPPSIQTFDEAHMMPKTGLSAFS